MLHKFQGWSDKFLVTPADGIEDAAGQVRRLQRRQQAYQDTEKFRLTAQLKL
jgi:hypothetical protein